MLKPLLLIMSVCRVSELKPRRFRRAGVIPYLQTPEGLVYVLARDRKYGTPGGFSGHVERDEPPLHAALREFKEESLGVFGEYTTSQIGDCYAIYDEKELLILLPVNLEKEKIQQLFGLRIRSNTDTSELLFFSSGELEQTLAGFGAETIHKRIRYLIMKAIEQYGMFL